MYYLGDVQEDEAQGIVDERHMENVDDEREGTKPCKPPAPHEVGHNAIAAIPNGYQPGYHGGLIQQRQGDEGDETPMEMERKNGFGNAGNEVDGQPYIQR